jgi:hypothetical protein
MLMWSNCTVYIFTVLIIVIKICYDAHVC